MKCGQRRIFAGDGGRFDVRQMEAREFEVVTKGAKGQAAATSSADNAAAGFGFFPQGQSAMFATGYGAGLMMPGFGTR